MFNCSVNNGHKNDDRNLIDIVIKIILPAPIRQQNDISNAMFELDILVHLALNSFYVTIAYLTETTV